MSGALCPFMYLHCSMSRTNGPSSYCRLLSFFVVCEPVGIFSQFVGVRLKQGMRATRDFKLSRGNTPGTPPCSASSLDIQKVVHIFNHMVEYSTLLDNTFHAVSDPTRRAILKMLSERQARVTE